MIYIVLIGAIVFIITNVIISFRNHPVTGVISLIVDIVLFLINPILAIIYVAVTNVIFVTRKLKRGY